MNRKSIRMAAFYFVSLLWMELIYRAYALDSFLDRGLLFVALFSLGLAFALTLISSIFKTRKANRTAGLICFAALTVWMLAETVYATIFRTVLVVESVKMAGQAIGSFWREMFRGIWSCLPQLLLIALPFVLLLLASGKPHKHVKDMESKGFIPSGLKGKEILAIVCALVVSIGIGEAATFLPSGGLMSIRDIYRRSFDPTLTVRNFGMLTTLRLDLTQTFLGLEEAPVTAMADIPQPVVIPEPVVTQEPAPENSDDTSPETSEGETSPEPVAEPEPIVYEDNVMDIDFASLAETETNSTLKKIHTYFASREATKQNEYTGMFEGYNLIFMTAEGFWKYAVDETHTPTLYKMANEGFVFNNFYCPLGTHSTCDGEFAVTTGLLPSNQYTAFFETIGDDMYFCMGNQLRDLGYPTTAYHAHYREYYRRDETHPNLGYDYYGIGQHGINIPMNWPESDRETMEFIWPKQQENMENSPWHLYFMTISGHLYYTWGGNYQCKKHQEEVQDMNMCDEAEAYVACQMELDQACEYLIEKLDETGQLENTLFVIAGDHYPYGMEESTWNEFAGHEMDQTFELPQSTLIIWSASMEEPIVVDKTCCSIDILPTISNLMGLEYDSRLLMGRDILSDCPGVAVFYNKSFVTDYGKYNVKTNEFIANEGVEIPEGYVKSMYDYVSGLFTATDWILKNDYYGKLGLKHDITPGKNSYYN